MRPEVVLSWRERLQAQGHDITEASTHIGKSRAYLSGLFSAAAQNPSKMPQPSAQTVLKLSELLGAPVGDLMGEEPSVKVSPAPGYHRELYEQSSRIFGDVLNMVHLMMAAKGVRPGVEDVLSWWRSTGGRLTDSGKLAESFDLIEIPTAEARSVKPHRVGKTSLATQVFGERSTARLKRLVDSLEEESQIALANSYRHASQAGFPVFSTPMVMSIDRPSMGIVDVRYIRLQMRVESSDGTPFIASYCFPI